jgi:hypothetical protein
MRSGHGWKCGKINDIPPTKESFMQGWHSVRHYLGVDAFGVNAVTKDKSGEMLILEHDEKDSGQQEVFFIHAGSAEFMIDGEKCVAEAGVFVAVEPQCVRSVKALEPKTQLIVIGAPVGKPYEVPKWDTLE